MASIRASLHVAVQYLCVRPTAAPWPHQNNAVSARMPRHGARTFPTAIAELHSNSGALPLLSAVQSKTTLPPTAVAGNCGHVKVNYAQAIRNIVEGQDVHAGLEAREAKQLFAAMLDGGIPELELGALLVALRVGKLPVSAMLGFEEALAEHVLSLSHWQDAAPRPVVIPAYGAVRGQPNLTPLVAMLLQRLHVPVLVHGTLESHGGLASAYVFRELGIMPCTTLSQARSTLEQERLAFVLTGVLAPGLAALLSLRARTGVIGLCRSMATLLDPFAGAGLRIVATDDPAECACLRELLLATGGTALLMRGVAGEAFANPRRRPRMELIREGASIVLFEQEHSHEHVAEMPAAAGEAGGEPRAAANYIRRILAGSAQLPPPIVNQLACCLYASGHTDDLNQAKAIVAVAIRGLAAA